MSRVATSPPPWFDFKAILEWRKLVKTEFRKTTRQYERAQPPRTSGGRRAFSKKQLISIGRTGQVPSEAKRSDKAEWKRNTELRQQREYFATALDGLLLTRPFSHITVDDLVTEAEKPFDSLYAAFSAGLPAVYCFWATTQIDLLNDTLTHLIQVELARGKSPRELLEAWLECLSKFIRERPYGRYSIFQFMTYELDILGSLVVSKVHDSLSSVQRQKLTETQREKLVKKQKEFIQLAATFHRAGARLISTLVPVLEASPAARRDAVRKLWRNEGQHSISWNLSMSLWLSILATICSVGLPEAEISEKQKQLLFDIWCRGALNE